MAQGKIETNSGLYQLHIYIKQEIEIEVGKLGKHIFPSGFYIYTGSASRNLKQRVSRHLSKEKKLHWHIDFLLNCPEIEIIDVKIYENSEISECELNLKTHLEAEGEFTMKGFGSSDCRNCKSHLMKIKKVHLY